MNLKSPIPNSDNLLSGGTSALNHDEHRGDTVVNDNEPPDEPQFVTVGQEKASRRRHAGGRSRLDFDLAEALRLRALGWSDRRIARKMNNVSRATVRKRLREYDACQQAHEPKPVQQAPSMPVPKPSALPAAPTAQGSLRTDYKPDWTLVPPSQGIPESEPVAEVEPVSVAPVTPPEPVSNYDQLVDYWAIRGRKDFKPDMGRFFLLNGQQNLAFATGLEQLAVSIDRWHEEYRNLEAFRDADRIWVVIDRRDDNREFLLSIVKDIWIRERCVISVGYVSFERWIQTVMRDRMHRMWDVRPRKWESYDSSQFEAAQHFVSLPQPNHVQRIEELLVPPPEPEKIIPDGGGYSTYGAPYPGCPPQADIPPQRGDRSCGFAF